LQLPIMALSAPALALMPVILAVITTRLRRRCGAFMTI